jgi:hypothetical protein
MIERVPIDAIIVRMILACRAGDNLETPTVGMIEQVETEEVVRGSQCQSRGPGKAKAIAFVKTVSSCRAFSDRVAISLESPIGRIGLVVKIVVANHVILAIDAKRMMPPVSERVVFD